MNCRTVKVAQFYGIDINDFAIKVLKICFLLAELQLSGEILDISVLDKNIITSNALRMDWNELLPNKKCSYIISNPPFCGARVMSKEQKTDVLNIFKNTKNVGNIDYVGCWYKKSSEYMKNTLIKTALVSTNSICQGEQVAILWKDLLKNGIHINFAYKTFKWNSESPVKAQVYCIIVGFSYINESDKIIFNGSEILEAKNINAYLQDATNIIVERRKTPICANVPKIKIGNKPIDGGNYLFTEKQKEEFIKKEPFSEKYFKRWVGSNELINNKKRYCLWLGDCSPNELSRMPLCLKKVKKVQRFRLRSKRKSTRELAKKPTRFQVENFPKCKSIAVPAVSSNKREYIPTEFLDKEFIASNRIFLIASDSLYHFGIINSSSHMDWMRITCGRLGVDYNYSKDIVYNTFPWPTPTKKQKENIEKTAKMILEARKLYPKCTLAQLYDPLTMPPELRKAHKLNDEAVFKAYGFSKNITEEECVAKLMEMYKDLVKEEK